MQASGVRTGSFLPLEFESVAYLKVEGKFKINYDGLSRVYEVKLLDRAPLRYRSAEHGPASLARSTRSQTIGRFAPS